MSIASPDKTSLDANSILSAHNETLAQNSRIFTFVMGELARAQNTVQKLAAYILSNGLALPELGEEGASGAAIAPINTVAPLAPARAPTPLHTPAASSVPTPTSALPGLLGELKDSHLSLAQRIEAPLEQIRSLSDGIRALTAQNQADARANDPKQRAVGVNGFLNRYMSSMQTPRARGTLRASAKVVTPNGLKEPLVISGNHSVYPEDIIGLIQEGHVKFPMVYFTQSSETPQGLVVVGKEHALVYPDTTDSNRMPTLYDQAGQNIPLSEPALDDIEATFKMASGII